MSDVTLEALAAQLELLLDGPTGGRELADALQTLSGTLVSINRSARGLDRRISDVKHDLQITIRSELIKFDGRQTDLRLLKLDKSLIERLTEVFDQRYVRKDPSA